MENIDWFIIIILFLLSLVLNKYFLSHISEKGKNLDTKEDIEVITEKIEHVKLIKIYIFLCIILKSKDNSLFIIRKNMQKIKELFVAKLQGYI